MLMTMLLAAAVASATCPTSQRGAALAAADLYDGPVREQAILAPDTTARRRGTIVQHWAVDGVYRAGRHLTLRCAYTHRPPVFVAIRRPVSACTMTQDHGHLTLGCR